MIDIRLFKPNDFADFCTIRREALVSAPDAFLMTVADFNQRDIISGMIGLFQQNEPGFEQRMMAWGVFSSSNARGLGLGGQMMQLLAKEAAKIENVDQIVLTVLASNKRAIRFYEKIGMEQFNPAENDPLIDHATTDDEAFMVLHLNSDL